MAKNFIIRPLYNRPEMLCASIEYEINAREYFVNDDYITIFAVEHGADPLCLKLIEKYPYEKMVVIRPFRYYGWRNIPEAFRQAFGFADDHVINIEDDSLIHKTYFKYVNEALNLVGRKNYSVINASRRNVEDTDANKIGYFDLFEGPSCLINKYFFLKYVDQYVNEDYYRNRNVVINQINIRNKNDPRSKYRKDRRNEFMHVGWDGMVNRLIDTANIEEGMHSISPFCDRQMHIGFYGFNRKGKFPLDSNNFVERLNFLDKVINDVDLMTKYGGGGYSDYKLFSEKLLSSWDGSLYLDK